MLLKWHQIQIDPILYVIETVRYIELETSKPVSNDLSARKT